MTLGLYFYTAIAREQSLWPGRIQARHRRISQLAKVRYLAAHLQQREVLPILPRVIELMGAVPQLI